MTHSITLQPFRRPEVGYCIDEIRLQIEVGFFGMVLYIDDYELISSCNCCNWWKTQILIKLKQRLLFCISKFSNSHITFSKSLYQKFLNSHLTHSQILIFILNFWLIQSDFWTDWCNICRLTFIKLITSYFQLSLLIFNLTSYFYI